MIKLAASSEIFKTSKKSHLIYCQSVSFPSIVNTIETIFKVQILNRINIYLAKRNLHIEPLSTDQSNKNLNSKINEKKKIKNTFFNQLKYDSILNFIYTHTKSKSQEATKEATERF